MKRSFFVVVSLVVLCLSVSDSFAGLLLEVDSGNEITVRIVQDSASSAGLGGVLNFTYVGNPPTIIDGTPTSSPDSHQLQWDWIVNDLDSSEPGLLKVTKISNFGSGTPGLGLAGYEFTFAVVFEDRHDLSLELSGVWDGEDVSQSAQVPEPITIALLGLGSLLIHRRR